MALVLSCCLAGVLRGQQSATVRESGGSPGRPNFVFFLVDDMGKYDIVCEGSTFYETPNIDRLASRSCRFDNAYSACQVCSPSRVAIQTGRHPTRIPITDYINPDGANQPERWRHNTRLLPASFELQMPLAERTIAEALKPLGYHNFFAGKWHLGGEGFMPTDQGYDINVGGGKYGHPPNGFFSPYKIETLHDGPHGEQLPLRLAHETADYIRSRADQSAPFFAMLSFYSVHAPIQTTQSLWRKYRDKADQLGLATSGPRFIFDRIQEVRQTQDNPLYAGMMESMDDAVGIVLESLEQSGQAENTVVLFTSDNGGVSSGDGYATAALPLRGGKGRQWEGGIRQPLYIHLPGQTSQTHCDVLTIGTDLFPTLVDLAV
ncbi:MAG: sulfatase, partial [Planctomycetales bacterium]|nr:sulfatase [Planctomycetales bacterium]